MGDTALAAPPHTTRFERSAVIQAAPAWTPTVEHMREWDASPFVNSVGVCGFRHEIFRHRLKAIG